MKWIDLPPVWTLVALVIAYNVPFPDIIGPAVVFGSLLLVLAGTLFVTALFEFSRARTTVVPHQNPSALITSGIFRLSRNPIYLADLLVLAGLSLIWGKFLGLLLVPALGWWLQRRFILPEEVTLEARFPEDFATYSQNTRRWL